MDIGCFIGDRRFSFEITKRGFTSGMLSDSELMDMAYTEWRTFVYLCTFIVVWALMPWILQIIQILSVIRLGIPIIFVREKIELWLLPIHLYGRVLWSLCWMCKLCNGSGLLDATLNSTIQITLLTVGWSVCHSLLWQYAEGAPSAVPASDWSSMHMWLTYSVY